MRVLLIKTSSMGDLIHTLPALSDAKAAIPTIQFDWIAEEPFKEIPQWHSAVDRVIPIALRKWRKNLFAATTRQHWSAFRSQLAGQQYDVILDAQGLAKSAFLTFLAKGKRIGLDWGSAREAVASLAYQQKCKVDFHQHAVVRMRQLFSQALNYPLPTRAPEFGVNKARFPTSTEKTPYLVFLHATTWDSKLWPEDYWLQLANLAAASGFRIKMGGGNPTEVARAERIAKQCEQIDLVPYLSISEMATLLAHSAGAVAVDTGFGHLAGALDIPLVSLYGPTNALFTGAVGHQSMNLSADFSCAPCLQRTCSYKPLTETVPACFGTLPPKKVWEIFVKLKNSKI